MGQKIDYSQNDGKTCSFCKKDLSQERNLIKSIAPDNILKDIYHPRCFDKKNTIKPKNKNKENK